MLIKGFDELHAVVCLDTLYLEGKCLYELIKELYRGVCALLLESSYESEAGIFVYGGILVKMLFHDLRISRDTDGRDNFYIYLYSFSRIMHLLIGFRDIFGVGRLYWLELLPP